MARQTAHEEGMLDKRFRERLKAARERLGLSQSEVARRLNICHATYHEYEHGKCSPSLSTIEKLSKVLQINPLELLNEKVSIPA
jgi:transcriptional regulator with XRE-family HTH domain